MTKLRSDWNGTGPVLEGRFYGSDLAIFVSIQRLPLFQEPDVILRKDDLEFDDYTR